ncbi:glucosyltransferase domain-containing protein [Cobetia amphilecti]|uniref:glucosyltransferase domain-containing protein n=1 Tax=Cobetia amphilecti TaxID=1055104 RepID=UPI000A05884E|nr:glucosyltransferase domain-containing protein [Cobetia amphilecti]
MTRSQPLSQACDTADTRRRQAWRILLASLVVIGLGLVPLIATRALYLDDMSRALDGYYGWMLNARPAAEGIMRLLGFGDVLVNVAPLPQLAAWGLAAGMALAWWRWLPGLSLVGCVVGNALIWLTPFTLQNFSYAFDSLPMSVALASAILASLVLRAGEKSEGEGESAGGVNERRGLWQAWQPPLSALLLLLLALCSYQPALNAFLVLGLLEALFAGAASTSLWSRWRMLLLRGALAAVALLLYLPITRLLVAGEYSQQHGQMLPFADPQALLAGLEHNLSVALGALREGLGQVTLLLSLALLACAALLRLLPLSAPLRHAEAAGAPKDRSRSARQLSLQRMSWALWALLLVPALWGPMLLLAEPVFHSRTLIAWGPLLGGALMLALSVRVREGASAEASATQIMTEAANTQRKPPIWRRLRQCSLIQCLLIVACLLLVRHVVIFAAWSNALAAQQTHETQLARTLVAQAREQGLPLDSPRDAERYQPRDALPVMVLGEAPVAPLARVARLQVAAVGQNLVAAFTPDNYWAVVRLRLAGASAVTLLRDEALKARLQAQSSCAPGDAVSQASDQTTSQSSAPSSVRSQVQSQVQSHVPSPALSLQEGVWVIDFRKPRQCD